MQPKVKSSGFALNTHGQLGHLAPLVAGEPRIAQQIRSQHGQGVVAPKNLAIDYKTRHAEQVQGNGFIGVLLEALLDMRAGNIVLGSQIGG